MHGKMDRKKMAILTFMLPVDRIERLLHFIGIDPVKWKEEWLNKHTTENLVAREEKQIFNFGR